jgi:hypothetical protein
VPPEAADRQQNMFRGGGAGSRARLSCHRSLRAEGLRRADPGVRGVHHLLTHPPLGDRIEDGLTACLNAKCPARDNCVRGREPRHSWLSSIVLEHRPTGTRSSNGRRAIAIAPGG